MVLNTPTNVCLIELHPFRCLCNRASKLVRGHFTQSTTAILEATLLDTKLIFVEGIPGSGKTNSAEFLCSQLERNGIPTAHIQEKDPNHPTRMEWQGETCRIEESLERWRDFAVSRAQSDSVTVLDGQLFHRNTAELFFNDVERVTIANYVRGVIDAVSHLNPTVVYLIQSDVPSFLRRTCDDRPAQPGWAQCRESRQRHLHALQRITTEHRIPKQNQNCTKGSPRGRPSKAGVAGVILRGNQIVMIRRKTRNQKTIVYGMHCISAP